MFLILAKTRNYGRTFEAWLDGERLAIPAGRQPFLDAARFLLSTGADPKARLVGQVEGACGPGFISTVGRSAALTVSEPDHGRHPPRFQRYAPFPEGYFRGPGAVRDGDSGFAGPEVPADA